MATGGGEMDRVAFLYGQLADLDLEERDRLTQLERTAGALQSDLFLAGGPLTSTPEVQSVIRGDKTVLIDGRSRVKNLKTFSGKTPVPNNEVSFRTWSLQVQQYLNDTGIKDQELKLAIVQSLSGKALDTVHTHILHQASTSRDIFQLLQHIYGETEDGSELLIKYFGILQESGQLGSDYLQKLYIKLTEVTMRDGIRAGEFQQHLNKQFFRGCRDDSLLRHIQTDPLYDQFGFLDLMDAIRKEETRLVAREKRFGTSLSEKETVQTLRVEVAALQIQLEKKDSIQKEGKKETARVDTSKPQQVSGNVGNRYQDRPRLSRRKVFCFRCGEDGHTMDGCKKDHNPQLVQEKLIGRAEAKKQHRPN
jgi:hypothetical protein